MKRKAIAGILLTLCLCLACGCSDRTTEDGGQSQASVSDMTSEAKPSKAEEPKSTEVPGTESGEPGAVPTATPEQKAEAEVLNNGGNFVSVDGKVYYREYGQYSLPGSAIGGAFTDCGENYGGAILRYVEGDGEPKTLAEYDEGFGPLYYHDGYLYSQMKVNYSESAVYRTNVKDGKPEIVCDGYLLGGSADGRYLVVQEYQEDKAVFKILDAGTISKAKYAAQTGYSSYVASREDKAFFVWHESNEEQWLMQLDIQGNLVTLAKLPVFYEGSLDYGEVHYFQAEKDMLTFAWELYGGTGHFLSESWLVKVPLCNSPEGVDPKQPLYEAKAEPMNLFGDGADDSYVTAYKNVFGSDDVKEAMIGSIEKPVSDGKGTAVIVQTMERVGDDYYAIVATAHRDPMEDIGWRWSYRMLSLEYRHYCGTAAPEVLARICPEEGPVTAYLWPVGASGSEAKQAVYKMATFMGPEVEPEIDQYLYGAEFSESLVYEFPEDGDIYDDWKRGDINDFYHEIKKYKNSYLSKLPEVDPYQGYVVPKSLKISEAMAFHLGFDEEGKINYVRPVVMD
ncbi:MAG: hypothetical protein K6F51_02430 [Acetatifactor sp.]|nr:hypothetical protein [Acetatifactor sp.]